MNINTTEIDALPPMTEYTPEPTVVDTIKAAYTNFRAVSLSNSKNMHYKDIMKEDAKTYTAKDPDNKAMYDRMAGYDIKDINKLEALYSAGKLDKTSTYIQENPFNADIFLVEDFMKFKELHPEASKELDDRIHSKALTELNDSQKVLDDSDHFIASMVGSMGGALTDIKTLQTLPLGAEVKGASMLATAAKGALQEMGIEGLAQVGIAPEVYSFKKELGIQTSVMQEATTAVTSMLTAGAFRGAGSLAMDFTKPLLKSNMNLTTEGLAKLKETNPELHAEYEQLAKGQATEDLVEHADNKHKVMFDEPVNKIDNPNAEGKALNEAEPISEVDMPTKKPTKEVVDYGEMEVVTGKDIDGNIETKSYNRMEEDLDMDGNALNLIKDENIKCLM